jgi:hypothetical protein
MEEIKPDIDQTINVLTINPVGGIGPVSLCGLVRGVGREDGISKEDSDSDIVVIVEERWPHTLIHLGKASARIGWTWGHQLPHAESLPLPATRNLFHPQHAA